MRLSPLECQMIRETVARRFGPDARVWLFGSRTDDQARGGDIDLLVETSTALEKDFLATVSLEVELQETLGDQKIDILLKHPGTQETPLHRIAKQTGIPL